MADRDSMEIFGEASDTIDERGWSGLLQAGFGTVFLAWVLAVADIMGSLFATLFLPIQMLFEGLGRFIEGTVFSGLEVIDAGAAASARSFTEGIGAFFGPFAFPAGVASVVIALLIVNWWWNRVDFAPWGIITRRFGR